MGMGKATGGKQRSRLQFLRVVTLGTHGVTYRSMHVGEDWVAVCYGWPSRDSDGPGGKLGSDSCYWALACIHVYTRMESLHGRVHRGSKELTWLEEQAH